LISVKQSDLCSKFNLNEKEITNIKNEQDASKRSVILRNIVVFKNILAKQERGILLLTFFSPEYSAIRHVEPKKILIELQKILDSGPISLDYLFSAFEMLLKEYQENPYESFSILSKKLLEIITSEPDKQTLKTWLEKLIQDLQGTPEMDTFCREILQKAILAQNQMEKDPSIASPEQKTALSQRQKAYLKRFGSDQEIYSYLQLDYWQSGGNKLEACKKLIENFRSNDRKLDLSGLNLTSLPDNLDFPWVQELDLSKNKLQTLAPISTFKYLSTLDLSYNKMSKVDGIPNFIPLKNLEKLQSVKLLAMGGSSKLLINRIKKDLISCDHIEWTDPLTLVDRTISKMPRELLGDFLRRRNRELDPLSGFSTMMISSTLPSIKEEQDPAPSENDLSHALELLNISDLDISSLTSQDSNILPWICRLAGQNKHTGLIFSQDPVLLPVLSSKLREIFECAQNNPDFFENILTPLVSDSIILCGDRTLYNLNEIIRRMELFKTKDLPLEEALQVFRKYFPVELVKKIARQAIAEQIATSSDEEKELIKKEALEIELDFLRHFQKEKNIPLAFSEGHYVGGYSETRENTLHALDTSLASQEKWIHYLASDPEWRNYFFLHSPSVKEKIKVLEEARDLRSGEIEEAADTLPDAEYERKYLELEQAFEASSEELLAQETEKVLLENSVI
jgi:hypothetical protein